MVGMILANVSNENFSKVLDPDFLRTAAHSCHPTSGIKAVKANNYHFIIVTMATSTNQ